MLTHCLICGAVDQGDRMLPVTAHANGLVMTGMRCRECESPEPVDLMKLAKKPNQQKDQPHGRKVSRG